MGKIRVSLVPGENSFHRFLDTFIYKTPNGSREGMSSIVAGKGFKQEAVGRGIFNVPVCRTDVEKHGYATTNNSQDIPRMLHANTVIQLKASSHRAYSCTEKCVEEFGATISFLFGFLL